MISICGPGLNGRRRRRSQLHPACGCKGTRRVGQRNRIRQHAFRKIRPGSEQSLLLDLHRHSERLIGGFRIDGKPYLTAVIRGKAGCALAFRKAFVHVLPHVLRIIQHNRSQGAAAAGNRQHQRNRCRRFPIRRGKISCDSASPSAKAFDFPRISPPPP